MNSYRYVDPQSSRVMKYDTNPQNAPIFQGNPSKVTIDFCIKFDPPKPGTLMLPGSSH